MKKFKEQAFDEGIPGIPLADIDINFNNGIFVKPSEIDMAPKIPGISPNKATKARKGSYDGIFFDSMAECICYLYFKFIENSIVERNTTIFINYVSSTGQNRKFYPDMIVNGELVEIKGRYFSDDYKKRQINNVRWIDVDSDEFKKMASQVNKKLPNWKENYLSKDVLAKMKEY